jgi:hypothetical protein
VPLEALVAAADDEDEDARELVWFSLLAKRLSLSVAMLPPPVVVVDAETGLIVLAAFIAPLDAAVDELLVADVVLLLPDRLAIGGSDSL